MQCQLTNPFPIRMKPKRADSSMTKRSCFCAPGFEGLVLQHYFFTLLLPIITNIVSVATCGLVSRFPIGLLACFALEREEIIGQPQNALEERALELAWSFHAHNIGCTCKSYMSLNVVRAAGTVDKSCRRLCVFCNARKART